MDIDNEAASTDSKRKRRESRGDAAPKKRRRSGKQAVHEANQQQAEPDGEDAGNIPQMFTITPAQNTAMTTAAQKFLEFIDSVISKHPAVELNMVLDRPEQPGQKLRRVGRKKSQASQLQNLHPERLPTQT